MWYLPTILCPVKVELRERSLSTRHWDCFPTACDTTIQLYMLMILCGQQKKQCAQGEHKPFCMCFCTGESQVDMSAALGRTKKIKKRDFLNKGAARVDPTNLFRDLAAWKHNTGLNVRGFAKSYIDPLRCDGSERRL